MISNYFKRINGSSENDSPSKIRRTSETEQPVIKAEVSVTSSLKTVRKWMKELYVDLDYELNC